MRHHAKTFLACAAGVLMASLAASAEVTMTIVTPADGKTVSSSYFYARLSGVTEMVVVRVDCAGATHFVMVNPIPPDPSARPGRPARQPSASDSCLPIVLGRQELTASVLSKDGKEVVAKQKVTFTVVKQSDADLAKGDYFKQVREWLNGPAAGASDAWGRFCTEVDRATRNDKPESWNSVRHQAELYMSARSDEFHSRLRAYADLVDIYLGAGRPADAMRAAEEANRIYEAEKGLVTNGEFFNGFPIIYDPRPAQNVTSPAHFAAMAKLYAIKGDLNTALSWYEKGTDFQVKQSQAGHLDAGARQRCLAEAADTCRAAARTIFLLTNDMTKYQQWMTRAGKYSSGSGGGDTSVNLLGE